MNDFINLLKSLVQDAHTYDKSTFLELYQNYEHSGADMNVWIEENFSTQIRQHPYAEISPLITAGIILHPNNN